MGLSIGDELRRSPRLLVRVPVNLELEGDQVLAHTAVITRHGALILLPRAFAPYALLRIVNMKTLVSCGCRVIWEGGEDRPGLHKVGIEFVDEADHFWGDDYPSGP